MKTCLRRGPVLNQCEETHGEYLLLTCSNKDARQWRVDGMDELISQAWGRQRPICRKVSCTVKRFTHPRF